MYRYAYALPVRARGAIGAAYTAEFSVLLPTAQATFHEVSDQWHRKYGGEWESVMPWRRAQTLTINGIDTLGCGDRQFDGVEIGGSGTPAVDHRDCYEINAEYLG